ncbi:hypothetical protein [Kitasatospora camelliae]|uniref:Pyrroloquinoline-quinone binding quinoprotein n=1 Tax=Kitasatospora camelliae TaxID=3156397 RepID=A0AAU8JZR9_9ACTN
MSWNPLRSLTPRSALPAVAVLLVLTAGAAAHANRPVPFGDRVVAGSGASPVSAGASPVGAQSAGAVAPDLEVGPGLEAYDGTTGKLLWSYRREGATALHFAMVGENAVVVWDDGMVTSVRPSDHEVRWHRSVPGLSDWLSGDGDPVLAAKSDAERREATAKRAAAALQTATETEPWVAVVTPSLTMGFRDRDGDLRYNSRPAAGCVYDPLRAVHTDNAVMVPRTCTGTTSAGSPIPGGISGFWLSGHGWQLNAGPEVLMRPLDKHRVAIDDGPIVGTKTFDTLEGAQETTCGALAEPFAAAPQGCQPRPDAG